MRLGNGVWYEGPALYDCYRKIQAGFSTQSSSGWDIFGYHKIIESCDKLEIHAVFRFEDILVSKKIYAIVWDCRFIDEIKPCTDLAIAHP